MSDAPETITTTVDRLRAEGFGRWYIERYLEGYFEGYVRGCVRGYFEGYAEALAEWLPIKFGMSSDEVFGIVWTADLEQLRVWCERVLLTATSLDEVFED